MRRSVNEDKETVKKITLSIITVTLNASEVIRETIQSVYDQTWRDYEYIIKDGKSKDGTIEIAEMFRTFFSEREIDYRIESKEDFGIYDAMNQAIKMCRGEWVLFLNAGDSFVNSCTLSNVFSGSHDKGLACIYGNTINIKLNIEYRKKGYPISSIYYRVPFIHQAVFVRTDIMTKYLFDTRYKIAADYDLYARLFDDGLTFKRIDVDIAKFDLSGVSQTNRQSAQDEVYDIQKRHNYLDKLKLRRFIFNNIIIPLKSSKSIYKIYAYIKKYF